jgi:hypothetical protein
MQIVNVGEIGAHLRAGLEDRFAPGEPPILALFEAK